MNWAEPGQRAPVIFNVGIRDFDAKATELFHFQCRHNAVYRQYVQALGLKAGEVINAHSIPPLPISFFKTHTVKSFEEPSSIVFTSSQTGGGEPSRHHVLYPGWYEQVFLQCFMAQYGQPSDYVFCCLLPSYLERQGSSLVYMAEKLVQLSGHPESGFFLKANDALLQAMQSAADKKVPVILLGVTFALLDFAEAFRSKLPGQVIVMETGGMKGRKKEMLRPELHDIVKQGLGVDAIHSEYGMTELMSQAYAKANGIYQPPPWMKVLVRSEDDPFALSASGEGLLIIFDLANVDSCCFIETADVGRVYADGSFEVLGRMDNSDIRGCSLMVA